MKWNEKSIEVIRAEIAKRKLLSKKPISLEKAKKAELKAEAKTELDE